MGEVGGGKGSGGGRGRKWVWGGGVYCIGDLDDCILDLWEGGMAKCIA